MNRSLTIIAVLLMAPAAFAEDVKVQYRLTGLFDLDRVDDLRRQAGTLTINDGIAPANVKLVNVDFETAVVTFAYDSDSKLFKDKNPQQVQELVNGQLRNVSRSTFNVYPLSTRKPDQLKQERIAVAGLDCKGCAFSAYRFVAVIDGVERVAVSFKEGHVTATIDPAKTNRKALIAALKNAEVDVIDPEPAAAAKPSAKP